ncbi:MULTISPECIES: hypothetical protein [unclassified Chryseobacterium]|uniref:hypothetical protein n=1 Tax=unclassified Chryseobacterium TaxID=2593645 RepID=UPI0009D83FA9|nr:MULTISPECIES: hypothetical protein [unclassified Chryseobacterium]SMC31384.1 hypothetical protein SAMN02787074_0176 [Chryseobacterium sp. YR221]
MIFPKAKKIARDLGWYKTEDGVFGLYKGYFFNVSDASLVSTPQYKFVSVTTGNLTEEKWLQINTELVTNKKRLKFTGFEIRDTSILFQFSETFIYTKLKTVYTLFDFLVDLFKKLNIPEQYKCHSCGTNQKINYYNLNDNGILLCDTCFHETNNKFYEIEKLRISKEKNYLTGFFGAVIFSIPWIILWVLSAVYLGRIASAMALIIAFFASIGYSFLKGREGTLKKYIIFLTNIVSIIMANVMIVLALLIKEGSTLKQAILEFQTNETVKEVFYTNIIISSILGLVAWIWILFVMKDEKLIIKRADKF